MACHILKGVPLCRYGNINFLLLHKFFQSLKIVSTDFLVAAAAADDRWVRFVWTLIWVITGSWEAWPIRWSDCGHVLSISWLCSSYISRFSSSCHTVVVYIPIFMYWPHVKGPLERWVMVAGQEKQVTHIIVNGGSSICNRWLCRPIDRFDINCNLIIFSRKIELDRNLHERNLQCSENAATCWPDSSLALISARKLLQLTMSLIEVIANHFEWIRFTRLHCSLENLCYFFQLVVFWCSTYTCTVIVNNELLSSFSFLVL